VTPGSTQVPDIVVCLVTSPRCDARSIARNVVERKLAACVNIAQPVQSLYWWEGELREDDEALLVIKTTLVAIPQLDELLRAIHPYENFELVCLDVVTGSHPYLMWIGDSTAPPR
jgi:periplasmic divalent cation tolerance protein